MSWPDVSMSLTFSLTHSTKCCECGHIHSTHTNQMFLKLDLPVSTANTTLKDLVEDHFNLSTKVLVFCEACRKLVEKEQTSKLTSADSTQFLAVILRRTAETMDGYKLLETEIISTNDAMIR